LNCGMAVNCPEETKTNPKGGAALSSLDPDRPARKQSLTKPREKLLQLVIASIRFNPRNHVG